MALKLNVLSDKKGSNPGGVCQLSGFSGQPLNGYFKYCVASQLPKSYPFRIENQPIYEVMASLFANKFGIRTPKNFVVEGQGLVFEGINAQKHVGRKNYFFSNLQPNPQTEIIDDRLGNLAGLDSIYLDALLIGDYNRRQNQVYQDGHSSYVDVGCLRFACANEGILKDEAKGLELKFNKDIKKELYQLDRLNVSISGNGDSVNVRDFFDSIPNVEIPYMTERGKIVRPLNQVISRDETEAIQGYLFQSFLNARKKFRDAQLLK